MASMTDSNTGKTLSKQRRRRRILMNDGDEDDGTPSKIETLIRSENTLESFSEINRSEATFASLSNVDTSETTFASFSNIERTETTFATSSLADTSETTFASLSNVDPSETTFASLSNVDTSETAFGSFGVIDRSETIFASSSHADNSGNVTTDDKPIPILKDLGESRLSQDVSSKYGNPITSDENANELVSYKREFEPYSYSMREDIQVDNLTTRQYQTIDNNDFVCYKTKSSALSINEERLTMPRQDEVQPTQTNMVYKEQHIHSESITGSVDPPSTSKRMRFAENVQKPLEISTDTYKKLSGIGSETPMVTKNISDEKDSSDKLHEIPTGVEFTNVDGGFKGVGFSDNDHLRTLEDNNLPLKTDAANHDKLVQNVQGNMQVTVQTKYVQEIPSAMELDNLSSEQLNEMPREGSPGISVSKSSQQETIPELSAKKAKRKLHDIGEEEATTQSQSNMQSFSPVPVKRKVRLSYNQRQSSPPNQAVDELTDKRNYRGRRVVSKTSNNFKYNKNTNDSEIPSTSNSSRTSTNQVFENISATRREGLESSTDYIDRAFETVDTQIANSRILPAQQSSPSPAREDGSDLQPDAASATHENSKQHSGERTKYRVQCYLELCPFRTLDSRKLMRKWQSEPTLNVTRLRTKRSKSLNLEKKTLPRQSSLAIQLKKPNARPLAPAYSVDALPFEMVIRNELHVKLKKTRRKNHPPPTLKESARYIEVDYLISRELERHEVQAPTIERKKVELNESYADIETFHVGKFNDKDDDDDFDKENYAANEMNSSYEVRKETPALPTLKRRNVEPMSKDFQKKPRKSRLNVKPLTVRPKSYKDEPTHVVVKQQYSVDITYGRIESFPNHMVHHAVTAESPRRDIIIAELPPAHKPVTKEPKLIKEELKPERRMASRLERATRDYPSTQSEEKKTQNEHIEIDKVERQKEDDIQGAPELQRTPSRSQSNDETQTVPDTFEAPDTTINEKNKKPVKRRHKQRVEPYRTEVPTYEEEPDVSSSKQRPTVEKVQVDDIQKLEEVREIFNVESGTNESRSQQLKSLEEDQFYSDKGDKLEEKPNDKPNTEITDTTDGLTSRPESNYGINIHRYLEDVVENKKEQNDEASEHEILEPYEPYLANYEIQRLMEKEEDDDDPVYLPHVQFQRKIQVTIVDKTKKKKRKKSKKKEKAQEQEQRQLTYATPGVTEDPKIQEPSTVETKPNNELERKDRLNTKEIAVQTLTFPEYTEVDTEDDSDQEMPEFQESTARRGFLINTIPEEQEDESPLSSQYQNDYVQRYSDDLIEPIKRVQRPSLEKSERSESHLTKEQERPKLMYEPNYGIQDFGFQEHAQINEEPVQSPKVENQQKSTDDFAEEQEITNTIYQPRNKIEELVYDEQNTKERKPVEYSAKSSPADPPQSSEIRPVDEMEPAKPTYLPRNEIQDLVLRDHMEKKEPNKTPLLTEPQNTAVHLVEEKQLSKTTYQPRYEIQDFVLEEHRQRKQQLVQPPPVKKKKKSATNTIQNEPELTKTVNLEEKEPEGNKSKEQPRQEIEGFLFQPGYEIKDFVLNGDTEKEKPTQLPLVEKTDFEIRDFVLNENTEQEKPTRAQPVREIDKTAIHLVEEEPQIAKFAYQEKYEIQDFVLDEDTEREKSTQPQPQPVEKMDKLEIHLVEEPPKYEIRDFVLNEEDTEREKPTQLQPVEKIDKSAIHLAEKEPQITKSAYQPKYEIQDFVLNEDTEREKSTQPQPQPQPQPVEKTDKLEIHLVEEPPKYEIRDFVLNEDTARKKPTQPQPVEKIDKSVIHVAEEEPQITKSSYQPNYEIRDFVLNEDTEREKSTQPQPQPVEKIDKLEIHLVEEPPKYEIRDFVLNEDTEREKPTQFQPVEKIDKSAIHLAEKEPQITKSAYQPKYKIQDFILNEDTEREKSTQPQPQLQPVEKTDKLDIYLVEKPPQITTSAYQPKYEIGDFVLNEDTEKEKPTQPQPQPVEKIDKSEIHLAEEEPQITKSAYQPKYEIQDFVLNEDSEREKSTQPQPQPIEKTDKLEIHLVEEPPKYEIRDFVLNEDTEREKPTQFQPVEKIDKSAIHLAEEEPQITKSAYKPKNEIRDFELNEDTEKEKPTQLQPAEKIDKSVIHLAEEEPQITKSAYHPKYKIQGFVLNEDIEREKPTQPQLVEKIDKSAIHLVEEPQITKSAYQPKYEIQDFVLNEDTEREKSTQPQPQPVEKIDKLEIHLVEEPPKYEIRDFVLNEDTEREKPTQFQPVEKIDKSAIHLAEKEPQITKSAYQPKYEIQDFIPNEDTEREKSTQPQPQLQPVEKTDKLDIYLVEEPPQITTSAYQPKYEIGDFVLNEDTEKEKPTQPQPQPVEKIYKSAIPLAEEEPQITKSAYQPKYEIQDFVLNEDSEREKSTQPQPQPIEKTDKVKIHLVEEPPKYEIRDFVLNENTEREKPTQLQPQPVEKIDKSEIHLAEEEPQITKSSYQPNYEIRDFVLNEDTEREKSTQPQPQPVEKIDKLEIHLVEEPPKYEIRDFVLNENTEREKPTQLQPQPVEKIDKSEIHLAEEEPQITKSAYKPKDEIRDFELNEDTEKEKPTQLQPAEKIDKSVIHLAEEEPQITKSAYHPKYKIQGFVLDEGTEKEKPTQPQLVEKIDKSVIHLVEERQITKSAYQPKYEIQDFVLNEHTEKEKPTQPQPVEKIDKLSINLVEEPQINKQAGREREKSTEPEPQPVEKIDKSPVSLVKSITPLYRQDFVLIEDEEKHNKGHPPDKSAVRVTKEPHQPIYETQDFVLNERTEIGDKPVQSPAVKKSQSPGVDLVDAGPIQPVHAYQQRYEIRDFAFEKHTESERKDKDAAQHLTEENPEKSIGHLVHEDEPETTKSMLQSRYGIKEFVLREHTEERKDDRTQLPPDERIETSAGDLVQGKPVPIESVCQSSHGKQDFVLQEKEGKEEIAQSLPSEKTEIFAEPELVKPMYYGTQHPVLIEGMVTPKPVEQKYERKENVVPFVVDEKPQIDDQEKTVNAVKGLPERIKQTQEKQASFQTIVQKETTQLEKVDIQTFVVEQKPKQEKTTGSLIALKKPKEMTFILVDDEPEPVKKVHKKPVDDQTSVVNERLQPGKESVSPMKRPEEKITGLVQEMPKQAKPTYEREVDVQSFSEEDKQKLLENETISISPIKRPELTTVTLVEEMPESIQRKYESDVDVHTYVEEETPQKDKANVYLRPDTELGRVSVDHVEQMPESVPQEITVSLAKELPEQVKAGYERKVDIQTSVVENGSPQQETKIAYVRPTNGPEEVTTDLVEQISESEDNRYEREEDIKKFVVEQPYLKKETVSIERPREITVTIVEEIPGQVKREYEQKVDIRVQEAPQLESEQVSLIPEERIVSRVEEKPESVKSVYEIKVDIETSIVEDTPQENEIDHVSLTKEPDEVTTEFVEHISESVDSRYERERNIKAFVKEKPHFKKETISTDRLRGITVCIVEEIPEQVTPGYERNVDIRPFDAEAEKATISTQYIQNQKNTTAKAKEEITESVKPDFKDAKDTTNGVAEDTMNGVPEVMPELVKSGYERELDITTTMAEETQQLEREPISTYHSKYKDDTTTKSVEEIPDPMTVSIAEEIPELNHQRNMRIEAFDADEKLQVETVSIRPVKKTEERTVSLVKEMSESVNPEYDKKVDIQTSVSDGTSHKTKETASITPIRRLHGITVIIVEEIPEQVNPAYKTPELEKKITYASSKKPIIQEKSQVKNATVSARNSRSQEKTVTPQQKEEIIYVPPNEQPEKVTTELTEEMSQLIKPRWETEVDIQTPTPKERIELEKEQRLEHSKPVSELVNKKDVDGVAMTVRHKRKFVGTSYDDKLITELVREEPLPLYEHTIRESVVENEDLSKNMLQSNLPAHINPVVTIENGIVSTNIINQHDVKHTDVDDYDNTVNVGTEYTVEKGEEMEMQLERSPTSSLASEKETKSLKYSEDESSKPSVEPWLTVRQKNTRNTSWGKRLQESLKEKAIVVERVTPDREVVGETVENAETLPESETIPRFFRGEHTAMDKTVPGNNVWFTVRMKRWESDLRKENRQKYVKEEQIFSELSSSTVSNDGSFDEASSLKSLSRTHSPTSDISRKSESSSEDPWISVRRKNKKGLKKGTRTNGKTVPSYDITDGMNTRHEATITKEGNDLSRIQKQEPSKISESSIQITATENGPMMAEVDSLNNHDTSETDSQSTENSGSRTLPWIEIGKRDSIKKLDSSLLTKPMITVNEKKNITVRIKKSVRRKHDWRSILRLSNSDRNKRYSQVNVQDRWVMLADGTTWWRLLVEDMDDFDKVKPRSDGKKFENIYEISNANNNEGATINLNQFSEELGRHEKQFSFVIDPKNLFQEN